MLETNKNCQYNPIDIIKWNELKKDLKKWNLSEIEEIKTNYEILQIQHWLLDSITDELNEIILNLIKNWKNPKYTLDEKLSFQKHINHITNKKASDLEIAIEINKFQNYILNTMLKNFINSI